MHHYRDERGKEVDFVLEDRHGRVVGVEIKSAATSRRRFAWTWEHTLWGNS